MYSNSKYVNLSVGLSYSQLYPTLHQTNSCLDSDKSGYDFGLRCLAAKCYFIIQFLRPFNILLVNESTSL